jgi:hypothetical protein
MSATTAASRAGGQVPRRVRLKSLDYLGRIPLRELHLGLVRELSGAKKQPGVNVFSNALEKEKFA